EAAGSENQYDRPWRGSSQGQTDEDFLDEVQSSQNGQPAPISIEVFEGGLLTVTATASRTTAPAGGAISFSATVTGANGSPLSYSWNFDGGAPNSSAASPETTFASAGQYAVTLQVTDAAGAGGGTEIPINVGPAAPAASGKHKQTGSGTSRKSHSPTGPRKSSGNHAGASAGTHQSQTTGQSNPSTSTTSQTATTPSSTSTTPTTSGAKTDTTPARTTGSHPRTPRHPAPVIKPPAPAPVSGPLVNGQLISDVTLLPAGASPLVHSVPAPAASAPPARQAVRTSPVPALAGALAVALLLALGATRELRGRRAWRALRLGS
ncbi:MAG TPA: PKD domain-containing protein, partial [Solirubrobacteraceae bacterium]